MTTNMSLRTLTPEYGPENFQRTQAGREALFLKLPADSRTLAAILGGGHDAETADLIDTLLHDIFAGQRTTSPQPPAHPRLERQASSSTRRLLQKQPDLPTIAGDESGWLDFDETFAGQKTTSLPPAAPPQSEQQTSSSARQLPQAQPDPPTTTQQGSGWLDFDEILGQAAQTTPAATTRPAQADSDDDSDNDEDYDASPIAYSSLIQGDR
ncbi:uncharacterized protein UDID_19419 [Ustilago sp. UG-2017a]|nr:uncharacterized protein UDID_19419 [Ustilago sp. UG-2017a]